MDLVLADIFESRNFVFVVGGAVALVWIVFATIESMTSTRCKERTKRELAAYVAEGSITPEDAQRILKSDSSIGSKIDQLL